jgi:hypothetical protein
MNIKERIKAIWDVLTKKHFVIYASNIKNEEELTRLFLVRNANKLHKLGRLSDARLDMVDSILYDRSVILQSMRDIAFGYIIPTIIYECQSEEDFNELKEQEIE